MVIANRCGQTTSTEAVLLVDVDPALNIARQGSNVVLTWSDPTYQLQAAPVLDESPDWVDMPGTSGITQPLGGNNQFYRLKQLE